MTLFVSAPVLTALAKMSVFCSFLAFFATSNFLTHVLLIGSQKPKYQNNKTKTTTTTRNKMQSKNKSNIMIQNKQDNKQKNKNKTTS